MATTATDVPKLIGWDAGELYIQVEHKGRARWVPVDGPDDNHDDHCWVDGVRYFIGAGRLIPRPPK